MFIINNRKIFFTITGAIVVVAIAAIAMFGLHLSIDFTGGTLVQVTYPGGRPAQSVLEQALNTDGYRNYSLRAVSTNDYVLQAQNISAQERNNITPTFSIDNAYPVTVDQLNDIGPTIGLELRNKSIVAIALVLVCILLFIAFAFRKVSKPVSSWMYGGMAIVGLIHNVIVTTGFFALLGHFTGAQVDTLFVTAVLTVLGFSIHDTIVVFDRVRENLRVNQDTNRKEDFAQVAGRSLNQTIVRSINTSLTVVFTLFVLYLIGPVSTQDFALTLLVGIIAGTYSSIFLTTPLLVEIEKSRRTK
jgi:preprotein translocase subunit SecF